MAASECCSPLPPPPPPPQPTAARKAPRARWLNRLLLIAHPLVWRGGDHRAVCAHFAVERSLDGIGPRCEDVDSPSTTCPSGMRADPCGPDGDAHPANEAR